MTSYAYQPKRKRILVTYSTPQWGETIAVPTEWPVAKIQRVVREWLELIA